MNVDEQKANRIISGKYKCVVEKNGKTSEAEFDVTLPIKHEDLIEAKASNVAFFEGRTLTMEVKNYFN